MLINISKKESNLRVLLGVLSIAAGSHVLWFILLPLGIMLIHSGLTSKCPISHLLGRQTEAAKKHFFINYLPKYNPQPVFIFKADNQLAFANDPAKKFFPDVHRYQDLINTSIDQVIQKEQINHNTLTLPDKKVYSLITRGSTELNGVVVYGNDISEIMTLNQEILDTQKEIVYAMGEIGETRSKETGDHVRRVAKYSQLLASLAGIDKTEADLIKFASPMHDIGKIGIPDAILNKPGKLDKDEFEIMKTHAEIGFNLLNHSTRPVLKAASLIAYHHHEKWNGSGYPQQLSGEDIHIYGRITAVADVFDALGSARVYKKAWPLEEILALLKEQRGIHFDPSLVDLLLENLPMFLEIREKHPN
ncbi:metal dependent phosphohydrolase [Psychromonas ingrahamii 37]|uniref:Metal dependent phosphohydrolase n=1 Tax=Psychromonas ingrahamii (strain DSM 17664 / CCUG 51855 / 37) TaxID=357804 RepID=A1SRQ7_PSYIN|nr:HD domain-containing phosphohydrolase [Psychromonas ingrahamii]ABM02172.1 metal dependent phosphohydrolase [Psychromonas ingrahamii 37]